MPTLLLQLKAPLQSWATEDGYTHRNTGSLPTKSGVIGLVASALGRARGSDISDLAALRFGVQTSPHRPRLTDFQTMGKRADGKPNPVGDEGISTGFHIHPSAWNPRTCDSSSESSRNPHPVYMPYLGRRACPASRPDPSRLVDKPLEQAFKGKEQAHVETIDARKHAGSTGQQPEYSRHATPNAMTPLFNAVARSTEKAEAMSDFTPADLPRVSERIPYLYLEQCVINARTMRW